MGWDVSSRDLAWDWDGMGLNYDFVGWDGTGQTWDRDRDGTKLSFLGTGRDHTFMGRDGTGWDVPSQSQ